MVIIAVMPYGSATTHFYPQVMDEPLPFRDEALLSSCCVNITISIIKLNTIPASSLPSILRNIHV